MQWYAEFVVGLEQLGIHLIEALWRVRLTFGRRVIRNSPVVDRGMMHMRPTRFPHLEPVLVRFETPVQQKLGLVFFP